MLVGVFTNGGVKEREHDFYCNIDEEKGSQENMNVEEEEDFSGFLIMKEENYGRLCLNFFISKKEDHKMCKTWQKTLIIKLLGRRVGFKIMELKLYQLWICDGIMEIIELSNDFYLVKFSAFSDYEFALTNGPWLIYDHYLIVYPWHSNFDSRRFKH